VTYTTSVNATYAYVGIDSATISGADAANFAVTGNTCGFINLAGTGYNESCSITVTFTPTSGGAKSAQLDVAWHNTGGPSGTQSVSLTGTGAQPAPKPNPQLPVEAFCVKTKERGNTFVQANPASFKPGGDWYALWSTNSKVVLDGHAVTLWFEDGNGVILAANVPGVGLTCDQPYVTADLKYADPSYGNR
jgi:hypothetical protein